jgi:DNA polymerase-3 subunit beta
MDIKIPVSVLQNLVDCASTPVSKKSPSQTLACLKLEAENNRLRVVGTDLYNTLNIQDEADVKVEGGGCANQEKLQKLVKKLPGDKVASLKIKDNNLFLSCGKSKYKLPVLTVQDFPKLPKPKGKAVIELCPISLLYLIQATKYAAALSGGGRPTLEGIQFMFSKARLTATASDGHQLSETYIKIKNSTKNKVTVPETSFQSIVAFCKQFPSEDEVISMAFDAGQMFLWTADVGCIVKLIDGNDLKSARLIQGDPVTKLRVNRPTVKVALERLLIINKDTRFIELVLQDGKFKIQLEDGSHGEGVENIPIELSTGDTLHMGLAPQYLLNYFSSSIEEWVDIEFRGSESPLICRSGNQELLGLIMPIRI